MKTEAELDEASGRALHQALTEDAPMRSVPRPDPNGSSYLSSGIKSARSAPGPSPTSQSSFASIEHLQHAAERLSNAEYMLQALGHSLVGDADLGKPRTLDKAMNVDRPLVGSVHNLADLINDMASSIQHEVERIRGGL